MGSAQSTSCEKLSVSCAVKIGDYQDRDFNELRNETVTVLEIGLYRQRCNNGIILHDFVRFLVRLKDGVTFEIKAEKFNSGISVTRPPLLWNRDVEMKYGCENLEECGKIRMEDLLAILKEPSPNYNLMSDNCWSYADATFKQVIRKFSETPSLSPEMRSYLARSLNNAPPVMPDKVLGSVISDVRTGVKVEVGLHSTLIGPFCPSSCLSEGLYYRPRQGCCMRCTFRVTCGRCTFRVACGRARCRRFHCTLSVESRYLSMGRDLAVTSFQEMEEVTFF